MQGFELSKAELVQLVNLKPSSPIEIYLVSCSGKQGDLPLLHCPSTKASTLCELGKASPLWQFVPLHLTPQLLACSA